MTEKTLLLVPTPDTVVQVQEMAEQAMEEAGIPLKTAMRVNIVVDEIYSNIIHYSNATRAKVNCRIENGVIHLTFIDNGIPYNPLGREDPDIKLDAMDRDPGGLGIYIYKKIMDKVEYCYKDGCNQLSLTKKV